MTHSEKIELAKYDLAAQYNLLMSDHNIIAEIKRNGTKQYDVIVNFELKKTYRNRRSARMYIKRLWNLKNNAL